MDLGVLAVVGRILVGGAFVFSGVRMVLALPQITGLLAAKSVPAAPVAAVAAAGFEIVFGVLAISGLWVPAVMLLLAAFVVVATVIVHDFWNNEPGMERMINQNAVIANAIIVGALISIAGLTG